MNQAVDQFNAASKIIHWLAALLIFGLLAIGFIMEDMPRGPEKFEMIGLHKSFGVLALLLLIIRIPVRVMNPVAPLLGTPRGDVIKAKALQGMLYLMMLIMPVSGMLMSQSAGYDVALCNQFLPQVGRSINSKLPDIASAFILAIIGIVVSLNAEEIQTLGMTTAIAVILHNLLGLGLGYAIARWNGHTEAEARTIALEVGMQNSGLGVALALKFYGPVAALPGALFSVWHNISGSLLAAFWKWQIDRKIRKIRQ